MSQMDERMFKCKICGAITKLTDYDWKERHHYYILEKEGICEVCARGVR
jgi:C4-type Zn-finger protein